MSETKKGEEWLREDLQLRGREFKYRHWILEGMSSKISITLKENK